MNIHEAQDLARGYDTTLTADKFKGIVVVAHRDRSLFTYVRAFVHRHEEFYFVFTEHHGPHVYHHEDVKITYAAHESSITPLPPEAH